MSFGGLFGKKKKIQSETPQDAIQKLKGIQDMLLKKQDFLEKKIEMELALAKKHGTKNKRAALQSLARKKRYEKQLTQIDGTLTTVEFQVEALENASTNTEVLKAMQVAAQSLKGAHQSMDIDKVHDVMDEIQEQQELAKEISDAVSNPVGFGHDYDEDELLKELELLQEEDLQEALLNVNEKDTNSVPVIGLPSAPQHEITRPKKDRKEEDDLADLEAWAS